MAWASKLAFFNRPVWNGSGRLVQPDALLHELWAMILDDTVDGAEVRISMSGWDLPADQVATEIVMTSLRGAVARGCDVKVIAPTLWTNPDPADPDNRPMWFNLVEGSALHWELEELLGDNIRYWRSGNAITRNINHTKFILTPQAQGESIQADWVIATGSCNLRRRDLDRTNELVLFGGRPGLYMAFESYWEALWAVCGGYSPSFYSEIHEEPALNTRLFFLPFSKENPPPLDPGAQADPVLDLLGSIVPGPEASVRVAMATWTNNGRGREVLAKLMELRQQGCDVRVIGHHETQVFEREEWQNCPLDPLAGDDAPKVGKCETSQDVWRTMHGTIPWAKSQTHTKFVLVEGPVRRGGVVANHRIVLGGTMNFSTPIWYEDKGMTEIVLEFLDDPYMWDQYRECWHWLCRQSWETWGAPDGPLA